MSADRPYFITTPIYYVNDVPHLGHAYTTVAVRCAGALHAARRATRQIPDRHRRARPEGRALGAGPRADAAGIRRPRLGRHSATWTGCSTSATTISSAPPRSVTSAACQALWQELERRGEIYLGRFAGWYSVRDEAFYERERTGRRQGPDRAPRSNGSRRITTSSGCRPGRTACSPFTTPIPRRSPRAAGATRSSALSNRASTICRSRAPASAGAFRCRAPAAMSSMSGSTR